jgi:hypothetical protein
LKEEKMACPHPVSKAFLFVLVTGMARATETGGDFRLPFTPGRAIRSSHISDFRVLDFWARNGRSWVIYWDDALDTPRYLAARAEHPLAAASANDGELTSAALEFVSRNRDFFGVSGIDLTDPTVTPVNRHRLVGFAQALQGVPVRGAGLRILVDPFGNIASVDCFVARSERLPVLPVPEWMDENAVLAKAGALTGGEMHEITREAVFPGGLLQGVSLGFCIEAALPQMPGAAELFFSVEGAYLGQIDASFHFSGHDVLDGLVAAEPILLGDCDTDPPTFLSGEILVQGFSTDPQDIYATANHASAIFPLPGVQFYATFPLFSSITADNGVGDFASCKDTDNVWPTLSYGVVDSNLEPCLRDIEYQPGIDAGKNEDGIKTMFMIHSALDWAIAREARPVELYDPAGLVDVDPTVPAVFTFQDDPNHTTSQSLMAFNLLAYHAVQQLLQEVRKRTSNNHIKVGDAFPLRVVVNSDALSFPEPKYEYSACKPTIFLSQQTSRETWTPPTIVQHEHAHHVILTVVGSTQNDEYVEAVADAITTYKNDNPRVGYLAPGVPGFPAFRYDDRDLLWSANLRLKMGTAFWQIYNGAEKEVISDLLYVWLGQRQVASQGQIAFDPAVLEDQLLVADAAMSGGGRVNRSPPHLYAIRRGFPDDGFLFYAPFIRGDVDHSGSVDLSDAVGALNYLFLGGKEDRCLEAMDSDDSGVLDLSDPLLILNYLFLGGSPPAYPFPDCDIDPTPLDFWCSQTSALCLGG